MKDILNRDWGHILTARSNDELLDPSRYHQMIVSIMSSQVARMQVTILVNSLTCLLLVLEVPVHYATASHAHLTLALLVRLMNH